MRPAYATGLRYDPYDPRDLLFVAPPLILPAIVDHRSEATPVRDQGQEGTCTGHALTAAAELLYWRELGKPPDFSERWAYEKAKEYDEWPGTDYEGSSVRGAIKAWLKVGLCDEKLWPYVAGKPGQPAASAAKNAATHPLATYERCLGLENLRHAIHHRGVVVVGATIHQGWFEAQGKEVIPYSAQKKDVGGHAFALVGYDDIRGLFWVKNSWGIAWGQGGYAGLTYQDALTGIRDAWSVSIPEKA
jgi:C1A family cysteine protease